MTPEQSSAFASASGFQPSALTFDMKLMVGGVAIIVSLLILAGLMHLLDSHSSWDKTLFVLSVCTLSFVLMLIFIYVA